MRSLVWLLGVMLVLLGLELSLSSSRGWTAVWIGTAVLWFFVGVGIAVMAGTKALTGKVGAGLNAASLRPRGEVPAPKS